MPSNCSGQICNWWYTWDQILGVMVFALMLQCKSPYSTSPYTTWMHEGLTGKSSLYIYMVQKQETQLKWWWDVVKLFAQIDSERNPCKWF